MRLHGPTLGDNFERSRILRGTREELSRGRNDLERYIAYQTALNYELFIANILDKNAEIVGNYSEVLIDRDLCHERYMELAIGITGVYLPSNIENLQKENEQAFIKQTEKISRMSLFESEFTEINTRIKEGSMDEGEIKKALERLEDLFSQFNGRSE